MRGSRARAEKDAGGVDGHDPLPVGESGVLDPVAPPMPALLTRTSGFIPAFDLRHRAAQSDSLVTSGRTDAPSPPARGSPPPWPCPRSRDVAEHDLRAFLRGQAPASAHPRAPPLINATFLESHAPPQFVLPDYCHRFRQEEEILRPVEVVLVELADQLLSAGEANSSDTARRRESRSARCNASPHPRPVDGPLIRCVVWLTMLGRLFATL